MENHIPIMKVLLVFYLLLGNSLLQPLLSKQWTEMIHDNRLIQHIIGFTTIITLLLIFSNGKISNQNVLVYALLTYLWFIFSTKLDLQWNIMIIILLIMAYLYENSQYHKQSDISTDKVLSDGEKVVLTRKIDKHRMYLTVGILIVTVVGVLIYANEKKLKVSIAGARHSMGGQAFVKGGIVLDMNELKSINITDSGALLVQSGALFSDIQHFLDQKGFSVKAMQSVNFCTVGGTLAANAHGIAHDPGCIGATVKKMRVMLANGEIKEMGPKNELFGLVIGGYGLFGIILDVELEVVKNEIYEWKRKIIDYKDLPKYFENNIKDSIHSKVGSHISEPLVRRSSIENQ